LLFVKELIFSYLEKVKKNIKKLYEEFSKKETDAYKGIRMGTLIGDIGERSFLKILKITLRIKV